jgi:hypothetical protein
MHAHSFALLIVASLTAGCRSGLHRTGEAKIGTAVPGTDTGNPGESGESGNLSLTQHASVPEDSPGVVLLMTQHPSGAFTVDGTVTGEFYVDTEIHADDREAFRYRLLDEEGAVVFERTSNGPMVVRTFLDHYSATTDVNVLATFPILGQFSVQVPLIDGASAVQFQSRDHSGGYVNVGQYDLDDRDRHHVGLSDKVIGHQSVWSGGDPADSLDIVLVGDGYTRDQMATWIGDATDMARELLTTAPFEQHQGRINIHRVDAVSNESGVSYDCVGECVMRDTAFGSIFPIELVNRSQGTDYNTIGVMQLDQWAVARAVGVVPYDLVLVVANTTRRGGMAVHYATTTKYEGWEKTGVHELAHILGPLGDEYVSNDCITDPRLGLPINIGDDATDPPWSHWIEAGTPLPTPDTEGHHHTVGAFEGAYNCTDLIRPARTCRMASTADKFCPVCSEVLTQQIYQYADFVDAVDVRRTATGWEVEVHTDWPTAWVTVIADGMVIDSDASNKTFAIPDDINDLTIEVELLADNVRASDDRLAETFNYTVTY